MYTLVLETSTSSAKALLYNQETKTYQVLQEELDKSFCHGEKIVVSHDAEGVFMQTMQLGRAIILNEKQNSNDEVNIKELVFVTTWHSLLFLDEKLQVSGGDLQAVSETFLWSYQTGQPHLKEFPDYHQRTGCNHSAIYPYMKLIDSGKLGLGEKSLDLTEYKIGDQASFSIHRLTGAFVTSHMMASGTGLYNLRRKDYDTELMDFIDIDRDRLPNIVDVSWRGELKLEWQSYLGIGNDCLVSAGYSDGGMNQLSSGGFRKDVISISIGTSGAIRTLVDSVDHLPYGLWTYNLGETYIQGAATSGAGKVLDHYRQVFWPLESADSVEDKLDGLSHVEDILFLPFIFGERNPGFMTEGPDGFYIHKSETCKKLDDINEADYDKLYLCVMEGILFNLYQCYELFDEKIRNSARVKLSGGITRSRTWRQMLCNIFGRPVEIEEVEHASLIGAIRLLDGGESSVSYMLKPDQIAHDKHMKKYRKYMEVYGKRK